MKVEYELLNERQYLRDILDCLLSQTIVDLTLYRKVYARFYVCNRLLHYYRQTAKKQGKEILL